MLALPLVVYMKHLAGVDDDSDAFSDSDMEDSDCILILKAFAGDRAGDRWFRAIVSADMVVQIGSKELRIGSDEFEVGTSLYARDLGLDDLEEIDLNCLKLSFASFPSPLTECPPALVNHLWIKRAKLECLVSNKALQYQMALLQQEILKCEKLMHHPHPNIAKYYGVVVEDGLIVGLAFKKYGHSLAEFNGTENDCPSIENVCTDIKAGIDHLHSLGLVHNDINPTNICIDGNGRAVIIDFDSAAPTGQPLTLRGGTTGWCIEDARISEEQNDIYGLRAIRAHLEFVFEGIEG